MEGYAATNRPPVVIAMVVVAGLLIAVSEYGLISRVRSGNAAVLIALAGLVIGWGLPLLVVAVAPPNPGCTYDCEGNAVLALLMWIGSALGWIVGVTSGGVRRHRRRRHRSTSAG